MAQYAHNEHIHLIIIKRLKQNVNSFYEIRILNYNMINFKINSL